MDASRRRFLVDAVATLAAAALPAPPMQTYGRGPYEDATRDGKELTRLMRALERAMNPPWVAHADGTTAPMDTEPMWKTVDLLYEQYIATKGAA